MRRREVVGLLAAAVWPRLASAQQPAKQHRKAFVHSALPVDQLTETAGLLWVRQFLGAMRRLGYVEGHNLILERYSAEGHHDQYMALAHDVVARQPDVIVVNFNPLVAVFKRVTSTIPITGIVADPIRSGLVANLARPGGNLTGVSVDAGLEIYGKRLQLLKELIPSTARVAYLGTEVEWDGVGGQELREASRHLLIALTSMQPKPVSPGELRRVFDEVSRTGVDALLVSPSGDFLAHRRLIVELADRSRLPTMYAFRDFVEVGGLVAYGSDAVEMAVRLADQVHHVLTGASPGEIPFHQVTGFELVINRRTANALGLEIPPTLLARADEVIE